MADHDKARHIHEVLGDARSAVSELRMMLADDLEERMVGKIVTAIRKNGDLIVGKAAMRRLAYETGEHCSHKFFDNALLRAEFRGIVEMTRSRYDPGRPFVFTLGAVEVADD